MRNSERARRLTILAMIPLFVAGISSCGTSGPEDGVDAEDIVEENGSSEAGSDPSADPTAVADPDLFDDVDSFIGQEVTVSADVNTVIDGTSFTIAGTGDASVDELLVVAPGEEAGVSEDSSVRVTGTVEESFDVAAVEEELGVSLDGTEYEEWQGQRYLLASRVDLDASDE
ncbi:hypothetical protein GCM10022377_25490 [Zhihengliuella alba]|uniref:DUF5666 domain-containing protein n=1 Tax=Zhihengliuella alba TaxID=547018 RepID=A0ABP7DVM6_9MICC